MVPGAEPANPVAQIVDRRINMSEIDPNLIKALLILGIIYFVWLILLTV